MIITLGVVIQLAKQSLFFCEMLGPNIVTKIEIAICKSVSEKDTKVIDCERNQNELICYDPAQRNRRASVYSQSSELT